MTEKTVYIIAILLLFIFILGVYFGTDMALQHV
ncbi:hypothetical protein J2749_002532 [Methanobacterium oryzae]